MARPFLLLRPFVKSACIALGAFFITNGGIRSADAPRIAEVTVEPAEVTLSDADQSVQFLVTLKMSDGTLRDGTRQAQYALTLPDRTAASIGTIEEGRLLPKGDGVITVSATVTDPASKKAV